MERIKMKEIKILLCSKPPKNYDYSVFTGSGDQRDLYFEGYLDWRMFPKLQGGETVWITHFDANVCRVLGIMNDLVPFFGKREVYIKGRTLAYFYSLGLHFLEEYFRFPRVTPKAQDVSKIVKKILLFNSFDIVNLGAAFYDIVDITYEECLEESTLSERGKKVGFWVIDTGYIDTERAKQDGYSINVVYRPRLKRVSIYILERGMGSFSGLSIAGIKLEGAFLSCGSTWGEEITKKQAFELFKEILKLV